MTAKAAGPPAALIACSKAVSLFLATGEIKQYFSSEVKHCLSYMSSPDNQAMLDKDRAKKARLELAKRIREAMDEAKPPVLGADLAEACKVTPQAVSGWRSTGRVGKQQLMNISRLTGRPLEYFVSESVHPVTKNGHQQPWLVERVIEPDEFLIVFRTWQDARHTDRQSLVAVAKTARKSHGTRRRRTG